MRERKQNMHYDIVPLPKDQWKGTAIPLTTRSDSYYDFEIYVDGVARDLIVYCERVPGGDWQAGIGGYE